MEQIKKKICVFIGSRANYGSIKSALRAIKNHPALELQIVAGASALLDKYGEVADLIEKDGFTISDRVHMIVEGSTPLTMAKSTGFGLSELATSFANLKPDVVLVVGDRYEVMAAAVAATFMNIPLAHTMGGEVSGSIDESTRHAITKLAHVHFPASVVARERIIKLGENPNNIYHVGCPRMDEVASILDDTSVPVAQFEGVGTIVDVTKPFLFVSQHPVTTEYGQGEKQMRSILQAIKQLNIPTIMLWPNADAGAEELARAIRKYREHESSDGPAMHFFKNLPMNVYFHFMNRAACMIGNSSSLVREGEFIGTPGVLVGTRQNNRLRGKNVIQVDYDTQEILNAVRQQLAHGSYERGKLYGEGTAGEKIADVLAAHEHTLQKTITY